MRMTGIGLITAAMLAGSMGIAVAQTSTTTPSPSAASPGAMKCWDSVTKQTGAQRDPEPEQRQQHKPKHQQQH